MNSYNKNLHGSVVSLLNDQETTLKQLNGQRDASELSLYYAQGDCITAEGKLKIANQTYDYQNTIQSEVSVNSNIVTNVLQSARHANELVDKAISNTAIAAANVQIAANAIMKLASNVGSIYSIINVADFESEIYEEATKVQKGISETAYLAETVSQKSMEASTLIAEVNTNNLVNKATITNNDIKNVLETVTTDFNKATEQVKIIRQTIQNANQAKKKADGKLENVNASYAASETANELSNKELNLAVNVSATYDTKSDGHQYTVSFDSFTTAFDEEDIDSKPHSVDAYYILLVKETAKHVFTIANAESIITKEKDKSYIKIKATNSSKSYSKLIPIDTLKDVNGDSFQLGDRYVIFVFAALSNVYKKDINVFEDYLTASSNSFDITNHLKPAYDIEVHLSSKSSTNPNEQILNVTVHNNLCSKIAYRCVFLPKEDIYTKDFLTVNASESIENKIEQPRFCFNLMIAELIPAGSYTTIETLDASNDTLQKGSLTLTNTMTDNFGNRLIKGNTYIPVIISISDDTVSINKTITNALSDVNNTKSFTYLG